LGPVKAGLTRFRRSVRWLGVALDKGVELGLRNPALSADPESRELAGLDEAMDGPRADAERRRDNLC
jgi:hypothetical protein